MKYTISSRPNKGVALLIVLSTLTVMMLLLSEMSYSSRVNVELAKSAANELRAEYLAKSAAEFAMVVLYADGILDKVMSNPAVAAMAGGGQPPADGKASETIDSHNDLWAKFSGLRITQAMEMAKAFLGAGAETEDGDEEKLDVPKEIEEGSIEEKEALGQKAGAGLTSDGENFENTGEVGNIMATDFIAELKADDSDFSFDISDESNKINLNSLSNKKLQPIIRTMLGKILGSEAELNYLQTKNLSIDKVVGMIKDWVDPDNNADESYGGGENDAYADLMPRYDVPNAPLESIDQLRMVACIDDELFEILKPYVTVFPKNTGGLKVNVNTLDKDTLLDWFPPLREHIEEVSTYYKQKESKEEAYFTSTEDLQKFLEEYGVNDPESRDIISKYLKLNTSVFRVVATGEFGEHSKQITMVVLRKSKKDKNKANQPKTKAKSVEIEDEKSDVVDDPFAKEGAENSYSRAAGMPFDILYWRLGQEN